MTDRRRRERRGSYEEERSSRHSDGYRERRKHRSRSPRNREDRHHLKESPPRCQKPPVDDDLSPPRSHIKVKKEPDVDLSPPRLHPPVKSEPDSDLSPPRMHPHTSGSAKGNQDDDLSPPRSRPHKRAFNAEGDLSPPRSRPQRGGGDADGDLSPPRGARPMERGHRGGGRDERERKDFRSQRDDRGHWRGGGGRGRGRREDRDSRRDRRPPRDEEDRRRNQSDRPDAPRHGDRFGGGAEGNGGGGGEGGEAGTAPPAGPDFGTSGKLAAETNTYKGVVINYSEPVEARIPKTRWRLYGFKGEETLPTLYVHRQSAYLVGRDRRVCDLPVDHPSCSKQHAVLQYRLIEYEKKDGSTGKRVRPYLIDLGSTNGCYINNQRIESSRYYELKEQDMIKFGFSSREYVILHENSKAEELEDEEEK